MDQSNFNTIERSRKQGHHLTLDERGMIQALHEQGYSLRGIAAAVGCAHTTVHYELRRGTPERKGGRGRMPKYTAKRGQQAYKEHRRNARRPCKLDSDNCEPFIQWMVEHVRKKRWSLDTCVGHARLQNLFQPEQIPCTKTLYNMLWAGKLPLSLFDVPQALGRKQHRKWNRKNKRMKGRSIEERPAIVSKGTEIGHWEIDTVVGQREGREAVAFTAVEKVTRNYIAIRISGRTSAGVEDAMNKLQDLYGKERFSQVFKTMTADNGPEFETLSKFERLGTSIYFTHPYSSWERPQNERHNGLLRDFIPKGTSIEPFSDEDVLTMADTLNQRPRRILGYHTPTELFDRFLDEVYAIDNVS